MSNVKQLRDLGDNTHAFKKTLNEYHGFLLIDPFRLKSRWIKHASVFKPQVAVTLQRLNLPPQPRQNHHRPSHSFIPSGSNLLKHFIYLILILAASIPLATLLRRARSPLWESWCMISNIKPLGFPVTNLLAQSIWNIFL